MPSDSHSQGGRRHFHRGRRGHDRRSGDRRTPHTPSQEHAARSDNVDVEQIMREIRSKIAQRHGVDLTDQQVQELAARRLESILDPRTIKPSLLDQLRRSAGARPDSVASADRASVPYEFEDSTLYDSPSAFTRFMRRLLNPILKLFFNPNPLIRALHIQSTLNADAARRDAERDERQAEWNALHYELLHRIVSETAKVSLEVQSLALKVESLSAKVDFNDRRVRGIEGVVHQPRPGGGRDREREVMPQVTPVAAAAAEATPGAVASSAPEGAAGEVPRRRRRRRRGRRGSGVPEGLAPAGSAVAPGLESSEPDDIDADEAETGDAGGDTVTTGTEEIDQTRDAVPVPPEDLAPEHVSSQLAVAQPEAREQAAPAVPDAEPEDDRS